MQPREKAVHHMENDMKAEQKTRAKADIQPNLVAAAVLGGDGGVGIGGEGGLGLGLGGLGGAGGTDDTQVGGADQGRKPSYCTFKGTEVSRTVVAKTKIPSARPPLGSVGEGTNTGK